MFGRDRSTSNGRNSGSSRSDARSGSAGRPRAAKTVRNLGSRFEGMRSDRSAADARRKAVKGARKIVKQEKPSSKPEPGRLSILGSWDWGRIRLWTVSIFFAVLWCCLWGRAFYLQIVMGPEYAAMAKRQHTAKEEVRGVRGNIIDRNGNVLASSVECRSIWANPSLIQDKQGTVQKLAKLLHTPPSTLSTRLNNDKRFVWLERKVPFETAEAIRELKLPGIYLDTEYQRAYPYKNLAGQLLGFVDIDEAGIEGLEKAFDAELAGRSVTMLVERDAAGRRLVAREGGRTGNLRGRDVRLTIDAQVQFFAEEALAENVEKFGARWGGCIVVDVPTGDVLAWAQYPFFDPGNKGKTPVADRRNRIATDMLEQGSTIKSFLISAALEEKAFTPETEINCEKGRWKFGRFTLHDTHPYAKLRFDKILHVSSNIGAAKIGLTLGAEKYYSYLTRLGFGQPTQLPLAGEAKGILRPPHKWADIDIATASFGQSFSATLAQVAQAYLCLASDGVKKPLRLVMDDSKECRLTNDEAPSLTAHIVAPGAPGDKIFSPETMRQVRSMLRGVVEEQGGTGRHARIPGLVVGGKTGTAQKADGNGRYGKGRVGSFVGMIPAEDPRYLICVLLDEPTKVQYGGIIAAPVFRDVALHTMAYHGHLPDTDDPVVVAVAEKEAARQSGGKPRAVPADQAQKPGPVEAYNAQLSELPDIPAQPEDPAAVPTVVGMGLRGAVEKFARKGIVPVVRGKGGMVIRQKPEPGSPWPENGQECILWLEEQTS